MEKISAIALRFVFKILIINNNTVKAPEFID